MSKNTKQFEFKLGRTGLIFFVLGMGISIFAFFLLGVKVGANLDTYPEKMAAWPASVVASLGLGPRPSTMIKEGSEESAGRAPGLSATNEENRPAAEKHDVISRVIEEAGKGETGQDVKIPPERQEPPVAEEIRKTPEEAPKAAKAPPAPVEAPPPPEPLKFAPDAAQPKTVPSGKYVIQVAAFREREKADKFCEEIARLGYRPEVESINETGSGAWFRVVIKTFNNMGDAKKAIRQLDEEVKGVKSVLRATNRPENER